MPRNLADLLAEIRALANEASSFLIELGPITLSIDETVEGIPIVINVLGATPGGIVSITPPDGLIFDPVALTLAGKPVTVGEYKIPIRQTHPQGSNSPNLSSATLIVLAKPVVPLGPWSFDNPAITFDRTDVTFDGFFGDGGSGPQPQPVQNFAFGPPVAQPSEGGGSTPAPVQNFAFGPPVAQPSEGGGSTPAPVQNFTFGAAGQQPAETAGSTSVPVQNFAFAATTIEPKEGS